MALSLALPFSLSCITEYRLGNCAPIAEVCRTLISQNKLDEAIVIGKILLKTVVESSCENKQNTINGQYNLFNMLSGAAAQLEKFEEGLDFSVAMVNILRSSLSPNAIENLRNLLIFMNDKVHSRDVSLVPSIDSIDSIDSIGSIGSIGSICFYLGASPMPDINCKIYGSEIAAIKLAEQLVLLGKTVYIAALFIPFAHIKNGVHYIPVRALYNAAAAAAANEQTCFDVMIVSRFIEYFVEFNVKTMAKQTYFWIHDTHIQPGFQNKQICCNAINLLNNLDLSKIDSIVTLSPWHQQHFVNAHGIDAVRTSVMGNGYDEDAFTVVDQQMQRQTRVPMSFIWVSCPVRGLVDVINHFGPIHAKYPNARLHVYRELEKECTHVPYVVFHGYKTNDEIILAMSKSDYWLYPTDFNETYCITALEAQMSRAFSVGNLKKRPSKYCIIDLFLKQEQKITSNFWICIFNALAGNYTRPRPYCLERF
jgi:glycosyltransferase involved in cell wall biosynthesis